MTTPDHFRAAILAEIERREFTRAELAERAGMTRAQLTNYLNGRKEINSGTLRSIAAALGTRWVLDTPKPRRPA